MIANNQRDWKINAAKGRERRTSEEAENVFSLDKE